MPRRVLISKFFLFLICITFLPFAFSQDNQESSNNDSTIDQNQNNKPSKEALDLDVAEVLHIDDSLEKINSSYNSFLESIGIPEGIFGALIATIIIIIFFFILRFVMKCIITYLRKLVLKYEEKYHLSEARITFYASSIMWVSTAILVCASFISILTAWNIELQWLSANTIQNFVASLISILLILAMGIIAIELASGVIDKLFSKENIKPSRASTIKPIAKNIAIGIIAVMFGMVALSQIGINILPLLAGAGVLGLAVGFGAQALVKDIITGFIIILEDLIQVGDVVTLQGKTGRIEKITVRKVQLRDLDGTVYTVPFGEISIVENHTKLFSYYLMDIGVAYRENIDEVRSVLESIGQELRSDDDYGKLILDDLEILGLDQFGDSAIIIKARIKTQPVKQWDVGREFNRRMKIAFDENNIEIPFPHQTIYIGEDKKGESPPLNVMVSSQDTFDAENSQDNHSVSNAKKTDTYKDTDKSQEHTDDES